MARRDFDPATALPDGRPAAKGTAFDPAGEGPWRGSLAGEAIGGGVTWRAVRGRLIPKARTYNLHVAKHEGRGLDLRASPPTAVRL